MAKERNKKVKTTDEIATENELIKLKMIAEFGGDFVGENNIPPEIENLFLKQIGQFHKQQQTAEVIDVFRFIGSPEYNHADDLGPKQLKVELKKLIKLFAKNRIIVETLAGAPDYDMYRFVTTELFKHPIQNIKLKRSWRTHFIYEEFHPNHDFDIRSVIQEVCHLLFIKPMAFIDPLFADEMKDSLGLSMDREDLRSKIEAFHQDWFRVAFISNEVLTLTILEDESAAEATVKVVGEITKNDGDSPITYETIVEFKFVNNETLGQWEVQQILSEYLA